MTQYIDKDALIAEIKRRISLFKKEKKTEKWSAEASQMNVISLGARIAMLEEILSLLDTLEVKEVDLEKELDSMITPELKFHKALPSLFGVAKHFFELGLLTTITEEDCKLIWNIGDDLPYMSEENFFKELLQRYKAQKGK